MPQDGTLMCDNVSNKELLLCMVSQFLNATHNDQLHLLSGAGHCTKFCDVLGSDFHVILKEMSAAKATKTVNVFVNEMDGLIGFCLPSVSHQDALKHL